jgi:hypothetical protein
MKNQPLADPLAERPDLKIRRFRLFGQEMGVAERGRNFGQENLCAQVYENKRVLAKSGRSLAENWPNFWPKKHAPTASLSWPNFWPKKTVRFREQQKSRKDD